jgi:ribosomal protein L40E
VKESHVWREYTRMNNVSTEDLTALLDGEPSKRLSAESLEAVRRILEERAETEAASEPKKICPRCSTANVSDAEFCVSCGVSMKDVPPVSRKRSARTVGRVSVTHETTVTTHLPGGSLMVKSPHGSGTSSYEGFEWPRWCPCCGEEADTVYVLRRSVGGWFGYPEESWSHTIPYCKSCLKHVYHLKYVICLCLALTLFSGTLFILGAHLTGDSAWFGIGGMLVVLLVATPTVWLKYLIVKPSLKKNCRFFGYPPAKYVRWRHEGRNTIHTFQFRDLEYAKAFADANGARVLETELLLPF